MTRLHLVRHGPTHAKAMVGWTDLPADLSDTAAIGRLGAYLPDSAVVVSSDLVRAKTTADAIQGPRPRLPDRPDLREIHFGDWEMRGFNDVEAKDAARMRAYWEQPGDISPPGGESWNAVCARVNQSLDEVMAEHSGESIIVVAHFGVILTQIQRAMALSSIDAFGYKIDTLSVTELSLTSAGWKTHCINHLP